MNKTGGKVVDGKITIYRKDRQQPFIYEADVEDFATKDNDLRSTKTEAMMRKQLIRI